MLKKGSEMKVKDLTPNAKNPRRMTEENKKALAKSLDKYGDLSGIIYNRRSKSLVGGHQRTSILPSDAKIVIEKKYENPTSAGTCAEGYVDHNGERLKYREVDWDKKTETEALIAANKHSGEWDSDLLRLNFADFPDMDLEAIGWDISELGDYGVEIEIDTNYFDNGFDDDPDETDEQYLRNNKGPDYEAERERLPDTVKRTYKNEDTTPADVKEIDPDAENPFEKSGQETDQVAKRHVLIIDLDTNEAKEDLKKKIRPLVEEAGGKFF